MRQANFIGIDFGTSGCRGIVIDKAGRVHAEAAVPLPPSRAAGSRVEQDPRRWRQATDTLLQRLLAQVDAATIRAISVDGTSGTVLLAGNDGKPLSPALMYNDSRAGPQAARIGAIAPEMSAAHGTGSGLAKLLWLLQQPLPAGGRIHSQADWIAGNLSGRYGVCDANNALKLGWDPVAQCWPGWLQPLSLPQGLLPDVVPAGTPTGRISAALATRWGLNEKTLIVSGTTDSTAAFIASGAALPGEAVTSLGSTLVLKVIAEQPLFAPEYGIYSHPFGKYWLVGGASNSGGAVLRQFFSDEQMQALSTQIDPNQPSGLDYYPLASPGERFPLCDPALAPRVTPRPDDDVQFFQGLLEGIAHIEKAGYDRLAELGAPYPTSVRSNGGGAANSAWTRIRGQLLGVPMLAATHTEAAYGAALLARSGASAV
jgi:sugar (pentulose or hexulose) kinase